MIVNFKKFSYNFQKNTKGHDKVQTLIYSRAHTLITPCMTLGRKLETWMCLNMPQGQEEQRFYIYISVPANALISSGQWKKRAKKKKKSRATVREKDSSLSDTRGQMCSKVRTAGRNILPSVRISALARAYTTTLLHICVRVSVYAPD